MDIVLGLCGMGVVLGVNDQHLAAFCEHDISLRADCLRAGGLHHRRDVRHRGQEAVQRRGLQGHLPESAHLRAGGHRQPGGRVCAALLISQAVRLIWPGLSGKCGPAVRRKRLFAALYLNEKLLKVFLS